MQEKHLSRKDTQADLILPKLDVGSIEATNTCQRRAIIVGIVATTLATLGAVGTCTALDPQIPATWRRLTDTEPQVNK